MAHVNVVQYCFRDMTLFSDLRGHYFVDISYISTTTFLSFLDF